MFRGAQQLLRSGDLEPVRGTLRARPTSRACTSAFTVRCVCVPRQAALSDMGLRVLQESDYGRYHGVHPLYSVAFLSLADRTQLGASQLVNVRALNGTGGIEPAAFSCGVVKATAFHPNVALIAPWVLGSTSVPRAGRTGRGCRAGNQRLRAEVTPGVEDPDEDDKARAITPAAAF